MKPEILRKLARTGRKYELTWRYFFNFTPTLAYKLNRRPVSGEAARVLGDLNRNGVALTSAQALLGPDSCYAELEATVERLEAEQADKIAVARVAAANNHNLRSSEKPFVFSLLGERPVLDANDVCVRFALQKPILQIANAYLGMYARLRYFNVWHNLMTKGQARASQLWHYDRDDLYYILKVFVFLVDIDDQTGPFTYAAGTHFKGGPRREPAYLYKEGYTTRSDDAQMAEIVPPERWIKGVGPKGTIVFADTHGYHKGGFAQERDRIMYTCMFSSPSAQPQPADELFERSGEIPLLSDKEQSFALAARSA